MKNFKTAIFAILAIILMMSASTFVNGQSFVKSLGWFPNTISVTKDGNFYCTELPTRQYIIDSATGNITDVTVKPILDTTTNFGAIKIVKLNDVYYYVFINKTTGDSLNIPEFRYNNHIDINGMSAAQCFKMNNNYFIFYYAGGGLGFYAKVTSPNDPAFASFIFKNSNVSNLCMVSYSTSNKNNIVVCEPTETVKTFLIYSNINNTNKLLGSLTDSNYVFNDNNKYSQSVIYYIRGINSDGDTSLASATHKTVLLYANRDMNKKIDLSWNQYKGFSVKYYVILRNNDSIAYVSDTTTEIIRWNDNNPLSDSVPVNYQIKVVKESPCEIPIEVTKRKGSKSYIIKSYAEAYSNVQSDITTGIENMETKNLTVSVYPNPVVNILNLNINKVTNGMIVNINGAVVKEFNEKIIDVSTLTSGLFFIKIINAEGVYTGKFIKQ